MTDKCVICQLEVEFCGHVGHRDITRYQCDRCGHFEITGSAMATMSMIAGTSATLISDWVNEQNGFGVTPLVRSEDLQKLVLRRHIGWSEKADRLLQALVKQTITPGEVIDIHNPKLSGRLQTVNLDEIGWIAKLLADENLVIQRASSLYTVLPRGYVRCDELRARLTSSLQGFVAMWFNQDTEDAWLNGFIPAIRQAGYDPLRIDQKEHANKICDEIVAEIRRSRFIVADFTGQRSGVYFEAGFAMGLGLPVIWTCREDDVSKLHFDIRQYNCVLWNTSAELTTKLNHRIQAVIGQGNRLPDPQ